MPVSDLYYMRNPATSLMLTNDAALAIDANGAAICLQNHTDRLVKLFKILRHVSSLSDVASALDIPEEDAEKFLARLTQQGVLLSGSAESLSRVLSPPNGTVSKVVCKRLMIGLSGTFQLVGSSLLGMMASLQGTFAEEVHVILTEGATKFLKPEIFSYYGLHLWSDAFQARECANVPHMWLGVHADVILVAATANTIHRLAVGACSDLLSLAISATTAPVIIAPAMNPLMLVNPAIARNIDQLRRDGMYVAEPGLGRELSNTSDGKFSFGGLGIPLRGLTPMISAVMARHAQRQSSANGHGNFRRQIPAVEQALAAK